MSFLSSEAELCCFKPTSPSCGSPLSQHPPPFVPLPHLLLVHPPVPFTFFTIHSVLPCRTSATGSPLDFPLPREIPYTVSSTISHLLITKFRNADRGHPLLKTVATCSLMSGSYHAGNRRSAISDQLSFKRHSPALPSQLSFTFPGLRHWLLPSCSLLSRTRFPRILRTSGQLFFDSAYLCEMLHGYSFLHSASL